jgi:glycerol-3-phosphate O-acyltransferase/dihydroxyacetone phosphate acyltransferase
MYSHPLLYGIYQILKGLVKILLALFYPDTKVTGREYLYLKGPTFVATNHPNTLIDALSGASRVDEQVFFIVNASLFKTPFQRWFFNTFFCIPIERPQDTGGRPINNKEAFARSTAHLEKGGHLFIAPEGTSIMERRLRPLKTGTARLAFTAEEANDFELNVRILPIGLNYEHPDKFGTKLLVNVGAPILVSEFEADFRADAYQAAQQTTQLLEERLRSLLIDTHNDEEDLLVRQLETVLQVTAPAGQQQHFQRTKRLIRALRQWQEANREEQMRFQKRVKEYFAQIDALQLTDQAVAADMGVPGRRQRPNTWLRAGALALSFPLFLYGLVNNFLPYFIPKWITRRLNLYVGYNATAKILTGMLTFPLFYGLQTRLVAAWWSWPVPFLYFISLIPMGYFAHGYPSFFRQVRAACRWRRLKKKASSQADTFIEERRNIWEWVQGAAQ